MKRFESCLVERVMSEPDSERRVGNMSWSVFWDEWAKRGGEQNAVCENTEEVLMKLCNSKFWKIESDDLSKVCLKSILKSKVLINTRVSE